MIQFRRTGAVAERADIKQLRSEFNERHCVVIRQLLEPQLLAWIQSSVDRAQWKEEIHEGIGVENVLDGGPVLQLLHLIANASVLLEAVHEITACGPFTWFGGRVYRMLPNSDHHDSWHDDAMDGRLVGLSVNLSERRYLGGLFRLRERGSNRALVEIANTGMGDAILFRISDQLEHEITSVHGRESKTAFAGWFKSNEPTLLRRLQAGKEQIRESVQESD